MSERIKTAAAATRKHVQEVLGKDSDDTKLLDMIRTCLKRGCDRTETIMLLGVLQDHFEERIKNSKV